MQDVKTPNAPLKNAAAPTEAEQNAHLPPDAAEAADQTASSAQSQTFLSERRAEIDAIDKKMAQLFEARMQSARQIARYKKERGIAVLDRSREAEVICKNSAYVADAELREYYVNFISSVMSLSRSLQHRETQGLKVVYSGAEGAFGYLAAKKAFPKAQLFPSPDFVSAYKSVESGEYDCAVLPIENSYAGDVSVVMDLAFSGGLYINAVTQTDVTHNLLIKKGAKLSDVRTVVSHPQALDQCAEFIREHGFEVMEYSNTALAAKFVAEECDETFAAIASAQAAEVFPLDVAVRGINTSRNNTTRFAVFSRAQNLPQPTDPDEGEHFILVFTAKNEAGSLAQALNIIGAHDYNLRTLISRPMKELLWNYYFYVEADGNIATENGKAMLQELSAVCAKLKLVGTYR